MDRPEPADPSEIDGTDDERAPLERDVLLRRFLDALAWVEEAGDALTLHLAVKKEQMAATRRVLEAGGTVPDLLPFGGEDGERSVKNPVARLEIARVEAQKAAYRLAHADGMTAAEIARAWEVSRQLVSRVLNSERA